MVSFALYRGNLHRVSDALRHYPMPPRAITLDQFRILTRRRDEAIVARLAASSKGNPSSDGEKDGEEEPKLGEEKKEEEGEGKIAEVSDPQPSEVGEEAKGAQDSKTINADAQVKEKYLDVDAGKGSEIGTTEAKPEVSNNLGTDKEKRRVQIEKKLEVLNQKKHHLVQILKQILHVEEEIIRGNAQSAALCSSIPLQAETAVDMGSATRHVPKLSVEVNISGDLGAELDATANHSAPRRQMHHMHGTSPSAAALARPPQQNALLSNPSSSMNTAAATSSPCRFAPTGHLGHHHSASLPPVSVPSSHFMASSPPPAASGSASLALRASPLTSSS